MTYSTSGINYPSQKQITLHTYVGTNSPKNSEGINVLPSLVGAALCGQNIRSIYGKDRLVMAQDFYNKANGENLYLNNASAGSGGDWWYDVMPNVYFYQLQSLFPDFNAEASAQFVTIADKFLQASQKMGGSATPWTPAQMNYRAWNFKTMEPNAVGVKEPEAAGTFGWLLYHSYKKTGNKSYLQGAEWSMEFLNNLTVNPSYELQLPYGVYAAAKMNAEIGTSYNTEKMVKWCFDRGPLRGWGTIVGKWGGYDVSGLVGEANDAGNDYAFLMNGMQQAAALVPMVRYDKRFAKAIGKWMLNVSNASRLFYTGFLPTGQQDGSNWSKANDPNSVIAHEAMKQKFQSLSPYATGDALGGGWAATNLALYGSSAVGYLGAIVQPTNVDKILQLNLTATDFYSDQSFPSYLYYNPYDTQKAVLVDLGTGQHDLYDCLTETFLIRDQTGPVSVVIAAKTAVSLVITPAGGNMTFEGSKMLVNDVVVDYQQHQQAYKFRPRIKALESKSYLLEKGSSTIIYCTAKDLDSDSLTYQWSGDQGTVGTGNTQVIWTAPPSLGKNVIKVVVKDLEGNADSATILIEVVDVINKAPIIESLATSKRYAALSENLSVNCLANDPNGDMLGYKWTSDAGTISGSGSAIGWMAPSVQGIYTISVTVDDGRGLATTAKISILVNNFSGSGQVIAWYPFTGNAEDRSGNQHHGTSKGAILTGDFVGTFLSAYYFNGGAQNIEVANTGKLNCEQAISLSLWCKPNLAADKEKFILSHGSWQNRWKLSITPTGQLRWTVNTTDRIVDLDSELVLQTDSIYHLVATYDGRAMALYTNGQLNSFKPQSGTIRATTLPLLMGQMLPAEAAYNYKGLLDEVRIYDYAIAPTEVDRLFAKGISTANIDLAGTEGISVYPNPATHTLYVRAEKDDLAAINIYIADVYGNLSKPPILFDGNRAAVDIASLPQGAYRLQVLKDQGRLSQCFLFIKY